MIYFIQNVIERHAWRKSYDLNHRRSNAVTRSIREATLSGLRYGHKLRLTLFRLAALQWSWRTTSGRNNVYPTEQLQNYLYSSMGIIYIFRNIPLTNSRDTPKVVFFDRRYEQYTETD